MTKRLHPIRKIVNGLAGHLYTYEQQSALIARHVKPLLDALAEHHRIFVGHEYSPKLPPRDCAHCRLLAAWKEPLK